MTAATDGRATPAAAGPGHREQAQAHRADPDPRGRPRRRGAGQPRPSFPARPRWPRPGATFAENALLKAHAIAQFTGLPAVADDSGLCVDALNGMPGVLSARWSGRHGDDAANLRLLLAQLADVPDERRGAQFVCAAALVLPPAASTSARARAGSLIREPRGQNGFGYDPIFVPESALSLRREMDPADKDPISHRGKALRGLAPVIAAFLG